MRVEHGYDCCVRSAHTKTKVRWSGARCTIVAMLCEHGKEVAYPLHYLKLKEAVGAKKLI